MFSCIGFDEGQHKRLRPAWRDLLEIICDQLGPARCIVLDVLYRRSCRRFPVRLFGRMSEDAGDSGVKQSVEFLIVLRRQASCQ
jgi:hypothetical protein